MKIVCKKVVGKETKNTIDSELPYTQEALKHSLRGSCPTPHNTLRPAPFPHHFITNNPRRKEDSLFITSTDLDVFPCSSLELANSGG